MDSTTKETGNAPAGGAASPSASSPSGTIMTWGEFFRSAPPQPKLRVAFLGLLALSTVVLSLWLILKIIAAQKPVPVEESPAPVAAESPVVGEGAGPAPNVFFELKDLSVPLQSRATGQSGYAQFSLYFDLDSEDTKHWMDLNRAHLITVTLEVATQLSLDDFHSPEGLVALKTKLLSAFQKEFGKNAPKDLSIKDWIMN